MSTFDLRVRRVPGPPLVSARLWLWGGLRLEPLPGAGLLTGRLLGEGTQRRSFERIAEETEALGMVLSTFGSIDAIGISLDALAEDWELALELLAELTFEPAFPAHRLEWAQRQAAAELESFLDQPGARARQRYLRQLYGEHPYGRSPLGDAASLAAVTPELCAEVHRQSLALGGCVTVAGAVDEDAVHHRLAGLFPAAKEPPPMPVLPAPRGVGPARQQEQLHRGEQVHLFMGHLTLPRHHPDIPALELLGILLGAGAGLSGRLPQRIREAEGLSYQVDVATQAGAGLDPGRFSVWLGTSPSTVGQAESAVREELQRLVEDGPEEAEVEEARSYVLGRDPFRRETGGQWADLLAEAALYGVEVHRPEWVREALEGLDAARLREVAQRWLHPEALRLTVGVPG